MTTFRSNTAILNELLASDTTVSTVVGLRVPDHGYVVGLGNEYGLQINTAQSFGPVIRQTVEDWLSVAQTRTGYIGSWHDTETGTLYLDCVEVIGEKGTAYNAAAERNELALYSIHNQEVITVDPEVSYQSNF